MAKARKSSKTIVPEVVVARDPKLMLEVAVHSNDRGTAELRAKHGATIEETMVAGVKRAHVAIECVIDSYHERMQITDRQHEAGLALRKLWLRAVHATAVTSAYGARNGSGEGPDSGVDARGQLWDVLERAGLAKRIAAANKPLLLTARGHEIWMERAPSELLQPGQVAIAVCGLDEWAGGTRRLMLLREALTALANYWKIAS